MPMTDLFLYILEKLLLKAISEDRDIELISMKERSIKICSLE